jgi:hypothetical protein
VEENAEQDGEANGRDDLIERPRHPLQLFEGNEGENDRSQSPRVNQPMKNTVDQSIRAPSKAIAIGNMRITVRLSTA